MRAGNLELGFVMNEHGFEGSSPSARFLLEGIE